MSLPPMLLLRSLRLRASGRVRFPRGWIGAVVSDDVNDYRVFRQMFVDPPAAGPVEPGAILDVRFRFARFSRAANRRLSRVPMPFIAVQPGFLSKTWMVGEDSDVFRGLYVWATVEDAESYWNSFPMRMMRRRSAEGTLVKSIIAIEPTGGER